MRWWARTVCCYSRGCGMVFFFNDTATTEIYTLSLHDALPIFQASTFQQAALEKDQPLSESIAVVRKNIHHLIRSEEHTSELQSPCNLVCRLLLEKKYYRHIHPPPSPVRGCSNILLQPARALE